MPSYTVVEPFFREEKVLSSRFIAILVPLKGRDFLVGALSAIKKDYPKADHYCYAALAGSFEKCSDDGEPPLCAGRPLLKLLHEGRLEGVLLCAVRYFGGSKLGLGRLRHVYLQTAEGCLGRASLYEMIQREVYDVKASYRAYEALKGFAAENALTLEKTIFGTVVELTALSDAKIDRPLGEILLHEGSYVYLGQRQALRRKT